MKTSHAREIRTAVIGGLAGLAFAAIVLNFDSPWAGILLWSYVVIGCTVAIIAGVHATRILIKHREVE